ncbi:hypothetical protein EBR04_00460 [bacterium]|nr:hypothetical protein [bacterium]
MPRAGSRGGRGAIAWGMAAAAAAAWAVESVAAPQRIELGGPRQAVVTIDERDGAYVLDVEAIAVTSFATASDREANRALAKEFALTALTRHLEVAADRQLAVQGLRVGGETLDGKRFRIGFSLPVDGVQISEKPAETTGLVADPAFSAYLLADPLLLEVEGAKVIRLDAGLETPADAPRRLLVLGVASAGVKGPTAADRVQAEKIARNRAYAHIVAERTGVLVARSETTDKRTVVTIEDDGRDAGSSVSEYLETTSARVRGLTQGFPVVARWRSADGSLAFVAVGGIIDPPAAGD